MAIAKPVPRGAGAADVRTYWLTWVATLTFFGGFYALLVPLPRYLEGAGLPDWQIGLVLGAFGVASLVGRPIAGVASDRFGSRSVMLVGATALAVGALGVLTTTNVAVLFLMRILQATGYVAFTTAGTALVVSVIAPAERASRLALFGAAANVAISLTPAAVAALVAIASVEAGLLAAGALALVGGTLALLVPARSARGEVEARRVSWAIPRRLWLPMVASALLGAGFAAFFQFAPILAERRAVSPGLLYAVYGAAIIATRLLGGRLLDRYEIGPVIAVAAGFMVVGHVTFAAASALTVLLPAAALIAISGGLFHPALIARHAALLPESPGRASAAFYVAFDLGIGLGSWLLGAALEVAGLPGLYLAAAACAAAVIPLARPLQGAARV